MIYVFAGNQQDFGAFETLVAEVQDLTVHRFMLQDLLYGIIFYGDTLMGLLDGPVGPQKQLPNLIMSANP